MESGVAIKTHFLRTLVVSLAVLSLGAALAVFSLAAATLGDSQSAFRKLESIEAGKVPRGSRVSFSRQEIDGWLQESARYHVPHGLNNLRLDLTAGRATAYANIDFLKVQQATSGGDPGWLLKNLFAGERPVVVTARFDSANGRARVDVERVEISGVPIQGAALNFVIANYVRPTFPDVKVDEWFELHFGVDRFTVAPSGVVVFLRK
jgi:hypothetical protein